MRCLPELPLCQADLNVIQYACGSLSQHKHSCSTVFAKSFCADSCCCAAAGQHQQTHRLQRN